MATLGTARHNRTPSGMKVAPMGYKDIEQIAKDSHSLLPKSNEGGEWYIDCLKVLEHTLPKAGFHYHIAEESELREHAGFTIPDHKLVVIRSDVYDGLFENNPFSRSTIIHELSHIILNHAATLHRGATLGKHKFCEDSEWQAKALTAAIMMPLEACQKAQTPQELSQICGTSSITATYRLNKLTERGCITTK